MSEWMTDGYGNKALVADPDEWSPRGWQPSGEPVEGERVWMQHREHGGRAQFPEAVAKTWESLGWEPSAPADPLLLLKDPVLVDVAPDPVPEDKAKPTKTPKPNATEKE